ncbi:MAG: AMP-binding protein [Oscillospiraceae bacterium]
MRTQHFNIFNTGTESFFTPGTQLASIARVKPDAPAVIYVSPENKESVMTWRELHELSNRIAWYLLGQGIGPGKSVLAALPNIPTHIALAFGIWKTGACYVPVSNRAPQRNLMEICACVSGRSSSELQSLTAIPPIRRTQNAVCRALRTCRSMPAIPILPTAPEVDGEDEGHRAGHAGRGERRRSADLVRRVRHAL